MAASPRPRANARTPRCHREHREDPEQRAALVHEIERVVGLEDARIRLRGAQADDEPERPADDGGSRQGYRDERLRAHGPPECAAAQQPCTEREHQPEDGEREQRSTGKRGKAQRLTRAKYRPQKLERHAHAGVRLFARHQEERCGEHRQRHGQCRAAPLHQNERGAEAGKNLRGEEDLEEGQRGRQQRRQRESSAVRAQEAADGYGKRRHHGIRVEQVGKEFAGERSEPPLGAMRAQHPGVSAQQQRPRSEGHGQG